MFHFSFFVILRAALSQIDDNEKAAWRSGGVSISGYAVQRDVFDFLKIYAGTSSHFAKPLVVGSVCLSFFLI
jgi:hypothetical protein